ncbi:hypothetical protein SLA2020_350570 [Shorea laevis]
MGGEVTMVAWPTGTRDFPPFPKQIVHYWKAAVSCGLTNLQVSQSAYPWSRHQSATAHTTPSPPPTPPDAQTRLPLRPAPASAAPPPQPKPQNAPLATLARTPPPPSQRSRQPNKLVTPRPGRQAWRNHHPIPILMNTGPTPGVQAELAPKCQIPPEPVPRPPQDS